LPPELGWFPEKITADIEAVILGMHAKPIILNYKSTRIRTEKYSYPNFYSNNQKIKHVLLLVVLMENNDYFNDFACNALP
jgi:hypothetical protein